MQYSDLVTLVSSPRINRYLYATKNNQNLAVKAYFLNINISGDIFKAISFLEISLRNQINTLIPDILGLDPDKWLIDVQKGKLSTSPDFKNTRRKINEAISLSKDGTHNQILCQLSFGFWCSLFSGYNYVVIGSKIMKSIHTNRAVDPQALRIRLHNIRLMRNRIAHQEPIIFNKKGKFSSDQVKILLKQIYWVQEYFCTRKLSQIAFYEQIKQDIIKIDQVSSKQKPSGMK